MIFGCLAVTRTDRASQLAAAQGAIQLRRGHKRTGRRSRAGKPQRQPGQAQPQHTQARNTNKQQHDTNKGESSHTSLIPSSFRVKRRGSAQREQHDRIQASLPSLNTFVFIDGSADASRALDSRRRRASRGLQGVCIPWGRPGIRWESIGDQNKLCMQTMRGRSTDSGRTLSCIVQQSSMQTETTQTDMRSGGATRESTHLETSSGRSAWHQRIKCVRISEARRS